MSNDIDNISLPGIAHIFVKFLDKKDAHERFITAISSQSEYKSVISLLKYLYSKEDWSPYECINYGITWADTFEGEEYWGIIDEEWRNLLDDVEIPVKKYNSIW